MLKKLTKNNFFILLVVLTIVMGVMEWKWMSLQQ